MNHNLQYALHKSNRGGLLYKELKCVPQSALRKANCERLNYKELKYVPESTIRIDEGQMWKGKL